MPQIIKLQTSRNQKGLQIIYQRLKLLQNSPKKIKRGHITREYALKNQILGKEPQKNKRVYKKYIKD